MIYYSYRLTIFVFDNMYFTIMGNIEGKIDRTQSKRWHC